MARDLVLEVVEQVRGNALGAAARDLDQLAIKTDHAAGSARDYSGELKKLEAQIAGTQLKIRALGSEFVSTHDKAVGKDLRGERSLLRQLERIRKELEDAAPSIAPAAAALGAAAGSRAGQGFMGSFVEMLGELPSRLRGSLIAAAVAAAVAASPLIGAVIGGAVVGAVGVGGLVGGIAAASHDPAVRAAATSFGESISAEFFAGGQAFVQPTIDALHILEDAFADLNLGDSWQRVAPYVTQVAHGIAGMAENFMPGFNRALDTAGPALQILANELPEIGAAISDMLTDISESKGTLEGWEFLLKAISSTIRVTGEGLGFLSDRFHEMVPVWAFLTDMPTSLGVEIPVISALHRRLVDVGNANEMVGHMAVRATHALVGEGNAAAAMADALNRLNQEMSDYLGIQLSVDQANQNAAEAMLRFTQGLKENGKDWRDTTEAGLANRAMLTNLVSAYMAIRDAQIANHVPAEQATAQFEAQLHVLEQLATKAGISKAALDDLVGDYFVNIRFSATTGTDAYTRALARAKAGIERPSGFAHGGDPQWGDTFWVGEAGAELMRLGPRPQVYSHQQSKAMASQSAESMRQVGETLAQIVTMLQVLQQRQPTVINVNAQQMSPKETAAVVQREIDWSR